MTDELARIHRFEREIEMAGTNTVESPLGVGVLTPELPRRHDSNYFLLERADSALEAMTEADRVLGAAGAGHRVILVLDERLGERLLSEFQAAGWGVNRHAFMVWRREPDKPVELSLAKEVGEADLRPGRTAAIRSYPWGSAELAVELLDAKILLADRAETRFFAVEVDGEIVAWTDLYLAQGMAQVEDVATKEEHRGKGYATAVVMRAVREAQAAGAEPIFLVADDEDWPKHLYERLGFEIVGRHHKFIRPG